MIAINDRLVALREEYAKGEQMLGDLEREAAQMRDSLLRIAGAIQVLEELQGDDDGAAGTEITGMGDANPRTGDADD